MIKVVHNSLSGGEQPYQATFEALDILGEVPLHLPYNPESWKVDVSPVWSPENLSGAALDRSRWNGNKPRSVHFQIKLSAQDYAQRMSDETYIIDMTKLMAVENALTKLHNWSTFPRDLTNEPTRIKVTFGDYQYVGSITRFTYSKMRTDHNGNTLIADLSFTLTENLDFGVSGGVL